MKATIKQQQQRTFVGQLGIVLMAIGMVIFNQAPWVMALGLGLVLGDTIEVTIDKEDADE